MAEQQRFFYYVKSDGDFHLFRDCHAIHGRRNVDRMASSIIDCVQEKYRAKHGHWMEMCTECRQRATPFRPMPPPEEEWAPPLARVHDEIQDRDEELDELGQIVDILEPEYESRLAPMAAGQR